VVVGNGMAGARAVEEILARRGADQFTITMFGDEPYGNYNRIMLSHVLSGEESDADIFLALTEGDNRNVMAAQVAAEALGARRVLAKINDPVRAAAYSELGVASLCRTALMADAINGYLGLPVSGMPGVIPPSRRHAEEHNEPAPLGPAPAGAIPVSVNTASTGREGSVSNGEV